MIDIHIHILPGVDDGSTDLEMSLEMASVAASTGVHSIITTPHCYKGRYENFASRQLQERWDRLHRAIKETGIPIRLYQGMEIMADDQLGDWLRQGKVWTLNGTRYFLVEFQFGEDPAYCTEILKKCIAAGYHPVVAHPARYYFVQNDPSIVYEWYRMGCAIQINKESLLGEEGKRAEETSNSLMRHGLVSCVASDAHRTYWRNTDMGRLEEFLMDTYGKEYTYMVLEENPGRILRGKSLVGYRAIPYEEGGYQ